MGQRKEGGTLRNCSLKERAAQKIAMGLLRNATPHSNLHSKGRFARGVRLPLAFAPRWRRRQSLTPRGPFSLERSATFRNAKSFHIDQSQATGGVQPPVVFPGGDFSSRVRF